MQKRTVSWDDLLTLSTLIRAGSYSACARELDITHATAIRRIRRLEAALGKPVATRSEGAFELTSAGRSALMAARQMEQSAGRLMREIEGTGSGVSGVVRIAATAALGSHFLTSRLPGLYAAHPDIVVRLELDDRVASLARRHAHLAVRLARPKEDDIVAQRVGTVRFGLYGSAAVPMDESTPLCALLDEGYDIPEATWPQGAQRRIAFQANNMLAICEAVRAGLGTASALCRPRRCGTTAVARGARSHARDLAGLPDRVSRCVALPAGDRVAGRYAVPVLTTSGQPFHH